MSRRPLARFRTPFAAPFVVTLLFASVLTGCGSGGNGAATISPPAPQDQSATPDQAQCTRAIPDSVIAAFGWPLGPAVTLTGGGCQRDAGQTSGSLLVSAPPLADPSSSGARTQLQTECSSISGESGGAVFEPAVSWLGDVQACARSRLTHQGLGLVEIYAVHGSTLLDVSISLTSPSTPASREAGAKALVAAAAAAL